MQVGQPAGALAQHAPPTFDDSLKPGRLYPRRSACWLPPPLDYCHPPIVPGTPTSTRRSCRALPGPVSAAYGSCSMHSTSSSAPPGPEGVRGSRPRRPRPGRLPARRLRDGHPPLPRRPPGDDGTASRPGRIAGPLPGLRAGRSGCHHLVQRPGIGAAGSDRRPGHGQMGPRPAAPDHARQRRLGHPGRLPVQLGPLDRPGRRPCRSSGHDPGPHRAGRPSARAGPGDPGRIGPRGRRRSRGMHHRAAGVRPNAAQSLLVGRTWPRPR